MFEEFAVFEDHEVDEVVFADYLFINEIEGRYFIRF